MRIECPRCRACCVDPSPAAMLEPKACPHCGYTPRPKRKRVAVDASPCPVCGTGCVDGVCRCDGEGDASGHTTSAAPERPFSWEDLRRALDEMDALLPPAPRVEFYAVPGSTDVAVMADDVPIKVLTAEQFEELKLGAP